MDSRRNGARSPSSSSRSRRDVDEFLVLYPRLVASAWRVASGYFTGSPRGEALAGAATDEALVRAMARWPRLRRSGNPEGSVALLTLEVCGAMVAKRRWFGDKRPSDEAPGPQDRSELASALERLGKRQRRVAALRQWAGLSDGDIGLCLGLDLEQVTAATVSGTAKLRTGAGAGVAAPEDAGARS